LSDVKITRKGFKCLRCGYEWIPRKEGQAPQLCPKCRSAYWNKPRVRFRRKKAQPSIKELKKALDPRRQIIREEIRETLETEKKRGKK
jgi:DNA-directed RNA polymerase subunit RPC12/RpoP